MAHSNRLTFTDYAFWSFTLAIAMLPIGLGGARAIPMGLAQAGMAACCLLLASTPKIRPQVIFFPRLQWALGLLAAVVVWAFIQTLPFVPSFMEHPLWHEAAAVLKVPVHGTIAVSPEDSLMGISNLLTYIGAGFLAYVLGQDAARARLILKTIWITGTVICGYGLLNYITGLNTILWWKKWAYEGDLTGTFVNRNHFAIYAGMVLICGTALVMESWRQDVQKRRPGQRMLALKEWLSRKGFLRLFLLAMVFLCIILSHSRSGLILSILGVGSYFFFYQVHLGNRRRALLTALGAVFAAILVLLLGIIFLERFSILFKDGSSLDRLKVYGLAWNAIKDNPWLGYGLGGFEPEFRLYQQYMLMEFNYAHSDMLESLVDLGIPFGIVLWGAIGLLLSGLWNGVLTRRQNGFYAVTGLAASLIVLTHAGIDFSLQTAGVTITWVTLLGVGLAQSWGQSAKQKLAKEEH